MNTITVTNKIPRQQSAQRDGCGIMEGGGDEREDKEARQASTLRIVFSRAPDRDGEDESRDAAFIGQPKPFIMRMLRSSACGCSGEMIGMRREAFPERSETMAEEGQSGESIMPEGK